MYSPNNKGSAFSIKDIIIVSIVGIFIYHFFIKEEQVVYGDGVLVKIAPIQNNILLKDTFLFNGYSFKKIASYDIKARVLSIEKYSKPFFSPVDFALGWQKMSDESILNQLNISQSNRWYHFKYQLPLKGATKKEIITSSANTHIIPANDNIKDIVMSVIKGNIVHMKGYLVNISGDNGFRWNSSTSRSDTGSGACELFYVEEIIIEQP